ncbi:hypothetical protein M089_0447, partial [Bacteroides ovatus str. 3725 D9 iii]
MVQPTRYWQMLIINYFTLEYSLEKENNNRKLRVKII